MKLNETTFQGCMVYLCMFICLFLIIEYSYNKYLIKPMSMIITQKYFDSNLGYTVYTFESNEIFITEVDSETYHSYNVGNSYTSQWVNILNKDNKN